MGVSNIHIFCPLTNWYCKITSNSTWFWHEIRLFIFKFCTLRPKRNAMFTENDPISEASGWQSSAIHSKNCIAHESPIFLEYISTIGFNCWYLKSRFGWCFNHDPSTTIEWCWQRQGSGMAADRCDAARRWQVTCCDPLHHQKTERPL